MNHAATPPHLWDEYALVQEKLDKVGEFRFYVKGWAATLVSAVVVAAATQPVPPGAILLGVPVVGLFYYFERYQGIWHRAYARRAYELERLLRGSGSQTGLVRAIMATQAEERRTLFGRFILQAHGLFYAGLLLFLFVALGAAAYSPTPSPPTPAEAHPAAPASLQPHPATSPTLYGAPTASPDAAASPATPTP